MPRRTTAAALALAGLLLATVAGCSPTTASAPPKAAPVGAPRVAASGDDTLLLGSLFPMTGEASASGAAQVAGAELAAREISEQGLALGHPVVIVHRDSVRDVSAAVADLLARGVDAVLWDATSPVPEDVASALASARVALVPLAEFANGGTPLDAGDEFAARLRTMDPGMEGTAGGGEAYDGVILTALAAVESHDDGGRSIAPALVRVSSGPVACGSWGECAAALAGTQQIAYEGVTGRRS
ncbi:ABC transporter substrate-binding protein [Cryobacterium fucosi]|uniref:ABC transporter substrate-binding protein n=1 Tax=Cryobacterium fucosi TaxID=1259157 RepID=A0A4R9BD45_9MICO|nr:ABC transporter substrate-binding protein [Cryobacterium fucosi]TFD80933.1 ABC transporter substrate-binding protein [Cryobacterium fucosi]